LDEAPQAWLRSLLGYPKRPFHAVFDLVHQRQIAMPSLPLDLHCNGLDAVQALVQDAPGHRMSDRLENASPVGQESAIAQRESAFSCRPRHPFQRHPACRAVHSPPGVHEGHADPPQWDELEAPHWQPVQPGPGRPQPGQIARPFSRASTATSCVGRGVLSLQWTLPYMKRYDPIEGGLQLRPVMASGAVVGHGVSTSNRDDINTTRIARAGAIILKKQLSPRRT
jgi:hypothetical protein